MACKHSLRASQQKARHLAVELTARGSTWEVRVAQADHIDQAQ
jgi:hypothetical protein